VAAQKNTTIPSAVVKLKKELTLEGRTMESRTRANHRVNMRIKMAAAQLAQERADMLGYAATVQRCTNNEDLATQAAQMMMVMLYSYK
jgi:hypothetical protein